MKLMLDTNVLLSAYAFGGVCRKLAEQVEGLHEIVVCEAILDLDGAIDGCA